MPVQQLLTVPQLGVEAGQRAPDQVRDSAMASTSLVRTQAGYRGFQSRCEAAEGFEPLRLVLPMRGDR